MLNPIKVQVYKALEEVLEPEIGLDIVNLGLVYEVNITEEKHCNIVMTLINHSCHINNYLKKQIQTVISNHLKEIQKITIEFVSNPPWSKDYLTRYAKLILGINI